MKNFITFLFISICLIALGVFLTGNDSLILKILGYVLSLLGVTTGWGALQRIIAVWRMRRLQKQDPESFAKMVSVYESAQSTWEEKNIKTQVAITMIQEFEGEVKKLAAERPDKTESEIQVMAAENVKRRNPDLYPGCERC